MDEGLDTDLGFTWTMRFYNTRSALNLELTMLTPEQKQEVKEKIVSYGGILSKANAADLIVFVDRLLEEEIAALRAKIEAIDLSTMTYGGFRRKVLELLTNNFN